MKRRVWCMAWSVAAFIAGTLAVQAQPARPGSDVPMTKAALPTGVTLSAWGEDLEHPWGLALLPQGGALVTERPGRLRVVSRQGELSAPVAGTPKVDARGQGGLLDVALHPDFERNGLVYLTYSEAGPGGNSTAVARGRLVQENGQWRFADSRVVFRQAPKHSSTLHFGSRLVFARDGKLFVTLGDRYSRRNDAQALDTHHGKVVRIEDDGAVPADNPFRGRQGALPETWSLGHRNSQGAALHPSTGELWMVEHGPRGGDELNIARAGKNYGWPRYTYGEEYSGGKIGEEASPPGFDPPLHSWVPSVSPSGLAFYTSQAIPQWTGSLFTGALSGQALVRLQLDGEKVVREERLLTDMGRRIRDVEVGPEGELYLLTDARQGQILVLRRGNPAPR
ncbi:MAG: PQQ-dependent sugar dehydrogenase [Pigmentiphaga sp.]|uniref:PQQ-dependent sugar dehydrogenase n=1 Tax=Pigmentiphaga sp. TaxID=1977564 RepID=UPI0029AEC605|nr:PQQ-dependent sugar dehydrogenase [Pigmentiphaga sp.]MDX3904987.1 PQQ-dependent sugar dehydrogenase [Pigmentiphaga sp.]